MNCYLVIELLKFEDVDTGDKYFGIKFDSGFRTIYTPVWIPNKSISDLDLLKEIMLEVENEDIQDTLAYMYESNSNIEIRGTAYAFSELEEVLAEKYGDAVYDEEEEEID